MKVYLQEQLMSVYQAIHDNYLGSLLLVVGSALLPFLAFFIYGLTKYLDISKWVIFYISITIAAALLIIATLFAYLYYSKTAFDDALYIFCESTNKISPNLEKNIAN